MNSPLSFWLQRFFSQAFVWMLAILLIVLIGFTLAKPALLWLFHDRWQWAPLEIWLRYTLGAAAIAIAPAGFFTLYAWIQYDEASLSKRWCVSIVVVSFLCGVEYLGIQLVKHHVVPALLRWLGA